MNKLLSKQPAHQTSTTYQSAFTILRRSSAFTIVELLVVIVVIGILAAITIVSYTGISSRATTASIQSDLTSASNQLKLYYTTYSSYPTAFNGSYCPTAPTADNNYCLKPSGTNILTYSSVSPNTFHLTSTNGTTSYSINDSTAPTISTTTSGSTVGSSCPTGYIPVPGSGTYSTTDFCVMKYEAKNVGGIATSQAASTPWLGITQTGTGSATDLALAACTGCHLITEAEWLTIAQNVLSVPSNWSTGTVGSGFIYSGHNDSNPNNALDADTNDANGYYGTGNVAPSNQKRTLTLTNGEVIWDLAGNGWEWTSGTAQSPIVQPGVTGGGSAWREWTAITNPGTLPTNPSPTATGIAAASIWDSGKGVGQIASSSDNVTLVGFRCGGSWGNGISTGVLTLDLRNTPSSTNASISFRVAK